MYCPDVRSNKTIAINVSRQQAPLPLVRLKIHRVIYVFNCIKGLLGHNEYDNFNTDSFYYNYCTRHASRARCSKDQLRFSSPPGDS